MKCPVCGSYDHKEMGLQSEQFSEQIVECNSCATVWSVNHGLTEVVRDSQKGSFLAALSECVEADDYNYAVAC